jgi:S1-C subfamily serine protease
MGSGARGGGRQAGVWLSLGLLVGLPAAAQYERPKQELSEAEKEAIETNRRMATPRPAARRLPLSPTEAVRVAVFKGARHSVVFISSITKQWLLEDNRTGNLYQVPPASGTGFVWDNLGHVVTNHHVITVDDPNSGPRGEAEDLQVTLANGKTYKAVVIARSLASDVAVLHVFAPLEQMKPLPLGTSRDLQVGQMVMAIGNPFGLDHTLTSGVISALGRDILTGFSTHIVDAIQTDAAINPGNSGGPLLDRGGRLIGMNTAIRTTTGTSAGVGFAIPVDTLNRLVPVLIAKGQLHRPELGIVTLPPAATANLGAKHGIAVDLVAPGSLAAQGGFRGLHTRPGAKEPVELADVILGDVIIGLNGHPVESDTQLMDLLELEPPATPLSFDVLRDGKPIRIVLRPGEPRPKSSAPTQPSTAPVKQSTDQAKPPATPAGPPSATVVPPTTPAAPAGTPPAKTEPPATPVKPPTAAAEPTAAPTEPTAAPTEPTAAPTEPTAAPAEPTAAPTEPPAAPVQPLATHTEPPSVQTPATAAGV